jgi:predicted enzyme related to lactoylglutathione lyase
MNHNPICWFEIYVDDMARAKAFYEAVLGKTLSRLDTPSLDLWAFDMEADKPGAGGALVRMPGVTPGGNGTLVYFACVDCALEESRVAAHGGKVVKPKFSLGQYGFCSLVLDTEGNMIGLYSMN